MSGFWSRKLGADRAQSKPYTAPQTSAARPWWDPALPPAQPAPQPVPAEPAAPAAPEVPRDVIARHLSKAQSSRETETCPGCGSGNYMAPPNMNVRKQCFDCGYPVIQSGSGPGALPSHLVGPVTPAKQIHDGRSYYDPKRIIFRL